MICDSLGCGMWVRLPVDLEKEKLLKQTGYKNYEISMKEMDSIGYSIDLDYLPNKLNTPLI